MSVLAEPEGFELILFPILFVDGDNVVLADPFVGHLAIDACKIAGPGTAIILNAFFATGVWP